MGGCKESKDCHDQHLCKLVKRDELEQVRKLVKDAVVLLQEVRPRGPREGQPLRPLADLAGN